MTDTGLSDPWSISVAGLYRELRRRLDQDEPAVLATIVDVEGSAYRRPGAKMLINSGESSLGAITAGCLEGPLVDLGTEVLDDSQPRVETFDLMEGDEWGLGLGCNGVIDIFLEPVDESLRPAVDTVMDRDQVTVFTVVASDSTNVSVGDRTVLDADDTHLPVDGRDPIAGDSDTTRASWANDLSDTTGSTTVSFDAQDGDMTIFADRVEPVPRLLLFGSQNDINPVARIGRLVGFEVIVASPRGSQSTIDEFPQAHEVVVTHPTDVAEHADELTYAVLMSHNLVDDRLAIETLLEESEAPYLGLMGPRERFEELREELDADGTTLSAADLDRISTPVGLDLGGGEPIQIALSIVSEALAVHNSRSGGRLKEQEGPIHDRIDSPAQ